MNVTNIIRGPGSWGGRDLVPQNGKLRPARSGTGGKYGTGERTAVGRGGGWHRGGNPCDAPLMGP